MPSERFEESRGARERSIAERTAAVYDRYYQDVGASRNDILLDPGVLMQSLAMQRAFVTALRRVGALRSWRVLDVGCGNGSGLSRRLDLGFAPQGVVGVDILADRLAQARDRNGTAPLVLADAACLPWGDATFDAASESSMFLQIPDEALAGGIAREMIRVVRPGGILLISDWRYDGGRTGYRAVSRHRLAGLFEIGQRTDLLFATPGALVPPVGRFLSRFAPSLYFAIQRLTPLLVGHVTTVLRVRS